MDDVRFKHVHIVKLCTVSERDLDLGTRKEFESFNFNEIISKI